MIILINGPCGVGKSEVSRRLLDYFDQGVMLDGECLGRVRSHPARDTFPDEYLYQTMQQLVAFHVAHGYANFVINHVFETPEMLARLRRSLSDLDSVTYAFRLTCAAEEIERRIAERGGGQSAALLQRFLKTSATQQAAAERGDLGYVVDTTNLDVAQAAEAIWSNICEAVDLAPYDQRWPAQYDAERELIRAALGKTAREIHHIGSTAVPGLDAKPIIDIMVAVHRLDAVPAMIPPLAALGYTFVDYPQNTDRCFFRKGLPRTHHLHVVEEGASLADHLAFRDALRASPELRAGYAELKHQLAARHPRDRAMYSDSKTTFIQAALAARRACRRSLSPGEGHA